jgi:hypothetical protein
MSTVPVPVTPVSPASETLEQRFRRLAGAWHRAVAPHSSSTIRNNHPAYREIISLGPSVVPLLLRDMEDNLTHWFVALREITGANPVPPEWSGDVPRMAECWLRWAREHGYKW